MHDTHDENLQSLTPKQARQKLHRILELMKSLSDLIQSETDMAKAGKLFDATNMLPKKAELSAQYLEELQQLQPLLPEFIGLLDIEMEKLTQNMEEFQRDLDNNMKTLERAKDISLSLIKSVEKTVSASENPEVYTPTALMNKPSQQKASISVSKVF